ncbi:hypothetical protein [Acinetobacter modestus]|uniref:hypothetical protein n=1 Tax=Acinetobacter modestus TaxID=1776740 RepID=UPI003019B026
MQFYNPESKVIKPDYAEAVAAWEKAGNKITELPFGHSNFKDGSIPKEETTIKPLDIEKYNAENKEKYSPIKTLKTEKTAKPTKAKAVKIHTQKPKKEKILKPKKASKLIVYGERAMIRLHNIEVFKIARDNNFNEVEALCIHHGYTVYRFYKDRPRCLKCVDCFQIKDLENHNRQNLNKELMLVAARNNEKKFTGVCKIHGDTSFFIIKTQFSRSGLNYKCFQCNAAHQLAYKNKKGAAA